MTFEKSVFINCPFDNDYFLILRSILFTILYLDFTPKISETSDSGKVRIEKIKQLIAQSKYSIHDISRIELNPNSLPRFNMPLECGIDFGAKEFGQSPLEEKVFLILDAIPFRYQEFMSDISGNDIRIHSKSTELAIKCVRDFLKINTKSKLELPKAIYSVYIEFESDFTTFAKDNKFDSKDINAITFSDLIEIINEWLSGWKTRKL